MYFDDLPVGTQFETGTRTLSADEIIAFAEDYDPQPFHLDPEAAKQTIYGGLIASGVQTMGVALRLVIESGVWADSSMGSPGLDEVRFILPVRPGDTLRVTGEIVHSAPSKSRPDRGRTRIHYDVYNQKDERVMSWKAIQLLKRKTP
ncbi:MAG: MaoC family dehydratase [Paracoccaceae bacterium]